MTCKYTLSLRDKLDLILSYEQFEVGTEFSKKYDQQMKYKVKFYKVEADGSLSLPMDYEKGFWVILKTFMVNPDFRIFGKDTGEKLHIKEQWFGAPYSCHGICPDTLQQ
jgi:hypothetical protein